MSSEEPRWNVDIQDAKGTVMGENNTVNQYFYASAPPAPAARKLPALLPYLMDRSEQEELLKEVIDAHARINAWRNPLCIIIHGDELECHDKFLERLWKISLPRILRMDTEQQTMKTYPLDWPASLSALEKFPARMVDLLSNAVLNHSGTDEEVRDALARHPVPVMLHTLVLSEDWLKFKDKLLEQFLLFWQKWELAPGQRLFLAILVKYQAAYSKRKLFSLAPPLNEQISNALSQLDFKSYAPLGGVILPPLMAIGRPEVERWARSQEVSKLFDTELLMQDIRAVFAQNQQVSMEALVDQLRPLLEKYLV